VEALAGIVEQVGFMEVSCAHGFASGRAAGHGRVDSSVGQVLAAVFLAAQVGRRMRRAHAPSAPLDARDSPR